MSRTKKSLKNIKTALIGQFLGLGFSFLGRVVFVRLLGAEYLGLNGLFTNIVSVLSFAELGVGSAITYSLYKPLADQDKSKVLLLMKLYRKAYTVIGFLVLFIGIAIIPFVGIFIADPPNISDIGLLFLLFVVNSAVSYFNSYKRSLLIADQNKYIANWYRYGFFIILNIVQIFILLKTRNYYYFLIAQIVFTVWENYCVAKTADKLYPYLKNKVEGTLEHGELATIKKNILALMGHKVGGIAVQSTDNIIISSFVGIIQVGLLSNYALVIGAINTSFGLVFQAVTASVGNLGVTESEKKSLAVFNQMNLANYWLYGVASVCLLIMLDPLIELWLGNDYVFPKEIVLMLVINFYIEGMRKSVLTFRDAYGLYWYDRYKPFFAAAINLIFSIILVKEIGLIGVFIGTALSILMTCTWLEPYILYKYVFKKSSGEYFIQYGVRTALCTASYYATDFLCDFVSVDHLPGFIAKLLICAIVPNIIMLLVFYKNEYFQLLVKNRLLEK